MGIPGPTSPGSCFRSSGICVAHVILSRARRNNVVVCYTSSLVEKLDVGVGGSTVLCSRGGATSAAHRQRRELLYPWPYARVHNPRRSQSLSFRNVIGELGRCSLRVPEVMGADVASAHDRNRTCPARFSWVSHGPRSTIVVPSTVFCERRPRDGR